MVLALSRMPSTCQGKPVNTLRIITAHFNISTLFSCCPTDGSGQSIQNETAGQAQTSSGRGAVSHGTTGAGRSGEICFQNRFLGYALRAALGMTVRAVRLRSGQAFALRAALGMTRSAILTSATPTRLNPCQSCPRPRCGEALREDESNFFLYGEAVFGYNI